MRVTGLGGGHGLAVSLRAARTYSDDVQAVVTVADDGGSSGRLSRQLGIPPPGDIRNCLVALSDESNLAELYQHRFSSGPLTGHSVGNLLIAALAELTGDFSDAVAEAGRLLGAHGTVHPATNELVTMRARVEGKVVKGQVAVAQTEGRIQAVYLKPRTPEANPAAVDAIMSADQVVLGPGSLFTSLIATLLVPGIKDALSETKAAKVFVLNNRMQQGETWGLDAMTHIEALLAHTGPTSVDCIVVQWPVLRGDGVPVDKAAIEALGINVIEADLTDAAGGHDPERLGKVLSDLVE
jgi:uncharacterized cofD-like protein